MKNISGEKADRLIAEADSMSQGEIKKLQMQRLHELVDYARENSPYFKEHYKRLKQNYELQDLPHTCKEELLNSFEDWVTDHEITKEATLEYLDSDKKHDSLYLEKYSALTTSGTTGEPMLMIRDSYHNMIHGALIQKRLMKRLDPDAFNPKKNKVASIIFTDPHVSSYLSFIKMKKSLGEYADNMIAISPTEGTNHIVKVLNEFQPDTITCYPSAMCALAIEQEKGTLHITPKAIACSAEVLTDEMYELFTRVFQCPVINNYCSTEGGEAAMSSTCGKLHINADWVIIEPVDRNMNVIKDEEVWSDGILITDLTNYVQPIIRYYVNDRIKIHQTCKCKNNFSHMEILGRTGGVAQICGSSIMIVNFYPVIAYTDHTYALQIVQTDTNDLEIRALFTQAADQEKIFREIEIKLRKLLDIEGCENYTIKWSNKELVRNVKGGKVPYFINLS